MADTITLLLLPSIPISGIECLEEDTVKTAVLVTRGSLWTGGLGKETRDTTSLQDRAVAAHPTTSCHDAMRFFSRYQAVLFGSQIQRRCLRTVHDHGGPPPSHGGGSSFSARLAESIGHQPWPSSTEKAFSFLLWIYLMGIITLVWLALSWWCKQIPRQTYLHLSDLTTMA